MTATRLPASVMRRALTQPWADLPIFQGDTFIARTPDSYKKFLWEWKYRPKTPVHYIPKSGNFEKLPNGEIKLIQNQPLPLLQPRELHEGVWGGEAIIKGYQKRKMTVRRVPHYWVPKLMSTVVYSEILDRYMTLTVTERTLRLIDKHYGFDSYILETHAGDLMSELAVKLKREMLLSLVQGSLYPDNPAKRDQVTQKYQQFIVPEEEAEWYGLTPKEAATKQKIIEETAKAPKPFKHAFRVELVEHLRVKQLEQGQEQEAKKTQSSSASGWISRVNPFSKD